MKKYKWVADHTLLLSKKKQIQKGELIPSDDVCSESIKVFLDRKWVEELAETGKKASAAGKKLAEEEAKKKELENKDKDENLSAKKSGPKKIAPKK